VASSSFPGLSVSTNTFNSSDCSGTLVAFYSLAIGSCISTGSSSFLVTSCAAGSGCANNYNTPDCSGTFTTQCAGNYQSSCTASGGTSTNAHGCIAKCFHKDTVITLLKENKEMTLESLKKLDSPCHVPHIIQSNGLKFITSCPDTMPLRLSPEHLVWTPNGYVEAGSLKVGNYLYNQELTSCEITKVESELNQEYYGLNCEESEVLADGWKVSTFGHIHTVPTLWMKYSSKLFGVKISSKIGDLFADGANYLGWFSN